MYPSARTCSRWPCSSCTHWSLFSWFLLLCSGFLWLQLSRMASAHHSLKFSSSGIFPKKQALALFPRSPGRPWLRLLRVFISLEV